MYKSLLFSYLPFRALCYEQCPAALDLLFLQDLSLNGRNAPRQISSSIPEAYADISKSHGIVRFGLGWLQNGSAPQYVTAGGLSQSVLDVERAATLMSAQVPQTSLQSTFVALSHLPSDPILAWPPLESHARIIAVSTSASVEQAQALVDSLRDLREIGFYTILLTPSPSSAWTAVSTNHGQPAVAVQTVQADFSDLGVKLAETVISWLRSIGCDSATPLRHMSEKEWQSGKLLGLNASIDHPVEQVVDGAGCEPCQDAPCSPCDAAMYVHLADKPAVVRVQLIN